MFFLGGGFLPHVNPPFIFFFFFEKVFLWGEVEERIKNYKKTDEKHNDSVFFLKLFRVHDFLEIIVASQSITDINFDILCVCLFLLGLDFHSLLRFVI